MHKIIYITAAAFLFAGCSSADEPATDSIGGYIQRADDTPNRASTRAGLISWFKTIDASEMQGECVIWHNMDDKPSLQSLMIYDQIVSKDKSLPGKEFDPFAAHELMDEACSVVGVN